MAIVVIDGSIISTFLSVPVIPALFTRVDGMSGLLGHLVRRGGRATTSTVLA